MNQKRFIQAHDIVITEELMTNPLFNKLWSNICKNDEFKDFLLKRTTVLEVYKCSIGICYIREYLTI